VGGTDNCLSRASALLLLQLLLLPLPLLTESSPATNAETAACTVAILQVNEGIR